MFNNKYEWCLALINKFGECPEFEFIFTPFKSKKEALKFLTIDRQKEVIEKLDNMIGNRHDFFESAQLILFKNRYKGDLLFPIQFKTVEENNK